METSHLGSYDAPNEHGFIAPLRTMHVTAGYGDRIYHSNPHMGTDLRGSIGTPIFAVAAGKIRYVDERINTSRGKWIVLEHATTKDRSFYQHNSRNLVVENQDVVQGQIIALAGNTGQVISSRGDGSHLHFELLKNTDNKLQGENKSFEDYRQPKYHVDPKDYIPGVYWVRTE
jgi:murein DD-endopeptidase MepM/ murein hydrolase activator NlpD